MKNISKNGFTLIELMIVVAIIGILASIAYPSYQESILKSRRADAKGALLNQANIMERHFTETNTYAGAPSPTDTDYYVLTIDSSTATAYTLKAVPKSAGGQDNDSCGTLFIKETGFKEAKKGGVVVAGCW